MPEDGPVPCPNASACMEEKFACTRPAVWNAVGGPEAQCARGRFVPPNCATADGGFARHCGAILMPPPEATRPGWWEAVLTNLRLNFTLQYMPQKALREEVLRAVSAKENVPFHWRWPHPLVAKVEADLLQFPEYSAACAAGYSPNPRWRSPMLLCLAFDRLLGVALLRLRGRDAAGVSRAAALAVTAVAKCLEAVQVELTVIPDGWCTNPLKARKQTVLRLTTCC